MNDNTNQIKDIKELNSQSEAELTNRQFDEKLIRSISLNLPGAVLLQSIRLSNIGKLFVDMNIPSEIDKKKENNIKMVFRNNWLTSEQRFIAIKNADTVVIVQIDYNKMFVSIDKTRLLHDIDAGNVLVIPDKDGGIHLKQKISGAYNDSCIQKPMYILNLAYDGKKHELVGGFEESARVQTYRVYILKALTHQRTGERFYSVYVENTLDQKDKNKIIVSGETLYEWERLRIVQVVYPVNILDIKQDDHKYSDEEQQGKGNTDIEIEESEIQFTSIDDDDILSDLEAFNDMVVGTDKGWSAGVGYDVGKDEMLRIMNTSGMGLDAQQSFLQQIQGIDNGVVDSVDKQDEEQATAPQDEGESYLKDYQRRCRTIVEVKSPIEEYIQQQLTALCLNNGVDNLIGGYALDNPMLLRIVETNANKLQNQILSSGIIEACEMQARRRVDLVHSIKQRAMSMCQGLYPQCIELSIVDMMQIYRVVIPNIILEQKRYKNYIKSCFQQNGQCNTQKRDKFLNLVKVNSYIQLDLEAKKQPKEFIGQERIKVYKVEDKEYRLQQLAFKAMTGFDACFRSMRLGNKYQEDAEFRHMTVIKSHKK